MKHLEKTRDAALKMGAIFFCSRCHFKEKVIISGTKLTARLKFSVQLSLFTLGVQTQTVDLRLRHCPTEIKELLTNEKHSNELWVAVEQPWEDLILSRRKHIWCLFVKFNEQSPSCSLIDVRRHTYYFAVRLQSMLMICLLTLPWRLACGVDLRGSSRVCSHASSWQC